MGHSQSSSTSTPVFKQFAGAFGNNDYTKSGQLGTQAQGMIGQGSSYDKPLQEALTNPSFMPTTQADTNLLNSLMDLTAGRGAVRGLGAPTQSSLAQAIAPELINLQQGQVQGLEAARGQDIQSQGQQLQALLNLIGLSMPQVVGGSTSNAKGTGVKWL